MLKLRFGSAMDGTRSTRPAMVAGVAVVGPLGLLSLVAPEEFTNPHAIVA